MDALIGFVCYFILFLIFISSLITGSEVGGLIVSLLVILVLITGTIYLSVRISQLKDFTRIKELKMKIGLLMERKDKLSEIVKLELAKYPELERDLISAVKSNVAVLLNLPNLKSDEIITRIFEEIKKLEDSIYEMKLSLLEVQKAVFYREKMSFLAFMIIPRYKYFFGEENPFVNN